MKGHNYMPSIPELHSFCAMQLLPALALVAATAVAQEAATPAPTPATTVGCGSLAPCLTDEGVFMQCYNPARAGCCDGLVYFLWKTYDGNRQVFQVCCHDAQGNGYSNDTCTVTTTAPVTTTKTPVTTAPQTTKTTVVTTATVTTKTPPTTSPSTTPSPGVTDPQVTETSTPATTAAATTTKPVTTAPSGASAQHIALLALTAVVAAVLC